ncbi:MAG: hypothetical protein D6712_00230 [Chloroflexi bacterium]|nr:MAG: hypothetical protein D6712_00230 [Chloroflexota bacterium]
MQFLRDSRHRSGLLFTVIALIVAFVLTLGVIQRPGYTDAFYHFNAAQRLVNGQGLTDAYLWNYIGLPETLPSPSHLYWMPLTSLISAAGMWLFNAPNAYWAAQVPLALLLAATAGLGYQLGWRLGQTRRHAWLAGLITLTGGFFARFWGATDTFAPYAFIGAACLLLLGIAQERRTSLKYWLLAGVLAGLGHLTRNDGLLLLLIGWLVIFWPWERWTWRSRFLPFIIFTLGYFLIMTPWFLRMISVNGAPLPVGGMQSIWFTSYDDLFSYPPIVTSDEFFAEGISLLLSSRWEAFTNNLGTFIAVEGFVVMAPLMLIGLWRRRNEPFLRAFTLYMLALHVAMTFVFAYPGYRGGLFHAAAALLPWWAALGIVGLDDVIAIVAKRRRHWHIPTAQRVFSFGLLLIVFALSWLAVSNGRVVDNGVPALYAEIDVALPPDARLMINDPAQFYYFTGREGVTLPNETPDAILEIARRYQVDYVLLEEGGIPLPLQFETPPDFLELIAEYDGAKLYAIQQNKSPN